MLVPYRQAVSEVRLCSVMALKKVERRRCVGSLLEGSEEE